MAVPKKNIKSKERQAQGTLEGQHGMTECPNAEP